MDLPQETDSNNTNTSIDAAILKEKFQEMYSQLISQGMSPNDAVAEALTKLHETTISHSPTIPFSTLKSSSNDILSSEINTMDELTLNILENNKKSISDLQKLVYKNFSNSNSLNSTCFKNHSRDEIKKCFYYLISNPILANTMRNALDSWRNQTWRNSKNWILNEHLNQFWILFDHPLLFDPEYRQIVGGMAKLIYYLNNSMKKKIEKRWETYKKEELKRLVDIFHQYITISLIGSELKMDMIFAVCDLLGILYRINELKNNFCFYFDFYNDGVNSELNLLTDYSKSAIFMVHNIILYRELNNLSFCDFPFLLDANSKSIILNYDSEYQQRNIINNSIFNSNIPYLILKINRHSIIQDSLQQLVQISSEQLKKPIKIKFIGEEGVDQGGVKKEFFQIIIRELLDRNYGMFLEDNETNTLWFNCDSLESILEYELIGILLGLAIYNGVILELHFSTLIYKKLMNKKINLNDIEIAFPLLGNGLRKLLQFNGDVENIFQLVFEISYEIFGEIKTIELIPNGKNINVNNLNKYEYVDKYIEYISTISIKKQYDAFHHGFHLVCGGDALSLFRSEELELLICGSPQFDFDALEQATQYEDGYNENSIAIRFFWKVVHTFTLNEKKQLLRFCTGSDRVPIRGLSEMIFIISRNGSDSNKLPTAHTCFNHLLLPDYSSEEKMRDRLVIAISQSEGFGLL